MADEKTVESDGPDLDSMTDDQVSDLAGKMSRGEDVSAAPEPEVAAETAAVDPDAEPAPDPVTGKVETVPHGRFEHERQRRIASETKYTDLEKRHATLEQRTANILAALTANATPKPQDETPAELDSMTQPIQVIDYLKSEIAAMKETAKQRETREAQAAEVQEIFRQTESRFDAAVQTDPTVRDAYQHAFESFRQQGAAYGLEGKALGDWLNRTEFEHMTFALRNELDVGKYIKNIAASFGWKPGAKIDPEPTVDVNAELGKIDKINGIKKAAGSLTPAGGAVARTGMPTPGELAAMSDAEYDAWRSKHTLSEAFTS